MVKERKAMKDEIDTEMNKSPVGVTETWSRGFDFPWSV